MKGRENWKKIKNTQTKMHKIKDTSTIPLQPDTSTPDYTRLDTCVNSNGRQRTKKSNSLSSVCYMSYVATSKMLHSQSSVAFLMVLHSSDRFGCSSATLLHVASVA